MYESPTASVASEFTRPITGSFISKPALTANGSSTKGDKRSASVCAIDGDAVIISDTTSPLSNTLWDAAGTSTSVSYDPATGFRLAKAYFCIQNSAQKGGEHTEYVIWQTWPMRVPPLSAAVVNGGVLEGNARYLRILEQLA